MSADDMAPARLPRRVRFDTRRRELQVAGITTLSPHMRRIELQGDLEGFQSLGFDDHVKLFLPDPDTGILVLPGEETGGARPIGRDYTPRRFDVAAGILVVDFAIHGIDGNAGPATRWAARAQPGDRLHIGGPRGSMIPPDGYDTYLLIGDDTALPAIGRRLAELPAGTHVLVLAEVDTPEDRLDFPTRANAAIHWIFRAGAHGGRGLADAVAHMSLPDQSVHAWVATEAGQARLIRQHLTERLGLDPQAMKVAGYWLKGETAAHIRID